jgi:hypothetical protein
VRGAGDYVKGEKGKVKCLVTMIKRNSLVGRCKVYYTFGDKKQSRVFRKFCQNKISIIRNMLFFQGETFLARDFVKIFETAGKLSQARYLTESSWKSLKFCEKCEALAEVSLVAMGN